MTHPGFKEVYFDDTCTRYAPGVGFENHFRGSDFRAGPERCCSTNYCNCIALAAVGLEDGLLGHFEEISVPGENQDRFYRAVAALEQIKPELIVLAGGRAVGESFSSRLAAADRPFAARLLGLYIDSSPETTLITHWNSGDAEAVNVHVDPAHAQITVVNVRSIPSAGYPGMGEM